MTGTAAALFVGLPVLAAAVWFALARLTAAVYAAQRGSTVRHLQTLFAPSLPDAQRLPVVVIPPDAGIRSIVVSATGGP